jgi:hypothetical protein
MLSRIAVIFAVLAISIAQASPLVLETDHGTEYSAQAALIACPQLSVKCVAEGDWMHPIGHLGKRRK